MSRDNAPDLTGDRLVETAGVEFMSRPSPISCARPVSPRFSFLIAERLMSNHNARGRRIVSRASSRRTL
jgi:hypothetical protein